MPSRGTESSTIRFGPFELDRANRELRKRGYVVKLPPQPFAVLLLLVESGGNIVSRDEIRKCIWNDDIFVDFERGINFAINQIREALGDKVAKPRFVETIPRRGYRFLCASQVTADRASPIAPPPVRNRFQSLAVLPFTNGTGPPEAEYLSEGISESIINLLSQFPDIRVVPRSSAFRYKGIDADLKKVRRELNVDVVLTGSVIQRGDRLIVQCELVDARQNAQIWGSQFNRRFEDIFELQEELARRISESLRLRLTPEEKRLLNKRPTENREAYLLYLKAMYYANKWTAAGIQQGFSYSRRAIEADPLFAGAYAGLAYLYIQVSYFSILSPIESFPAARAATLKALEIDPTLATAHACLSYILLAYDWDWAGAEKASRRAIELAPNIPAGHYVRSQWCLVNGRAEEAIEEAKKALELDPLSLPNMHNLANIYHELHRYELAIQQLQQILEFEPASPRAREALAFTYASMGKYEEAFAELGEPGPITDTDPRSMGIRGFWGIMMAMAGRQTEARKVLAELGLCSEAPSFRPAYYCAAIHALLGEKAEAFEWLDKARESHFGSLFHIKLKSYFETLHEDPRFSDLLRKMGLPN
jgi:TolB-like protein